MNNNNIPCIECKCLKFPVCKNKKYVYCNLLADYRVKIYHLNRTVTTHVCMQPYFNNLSMVYYEYGDGWYMNV